MRSPHLLYKIFWAEACLQRAVMDLDAAQDHGLFSRDVFLHQTQAGKYIRERAKDKLLGDPPMLPLDPKQTFQLFPPEEEEDHVAKMWASHPPNHERELNAKATYIRTEFDEASPWTLFDNRAELCEQVSIKFYRAVFRVRKGDVKWSSAAKVQEFLDEEYSETAFDVDRYGYLYNNRNIENVDLRALRDHSEECPNAPDDLLASHLSMYTPAVKKFAEVFQRHFEEAEMLNAIKQRWYRPKKRQFEMRGRTLHVREARDLLADVEKEIKADIEWLAEFDTKVFVTYYELAWHLKRDWALELYERYKFHYVIQEMWKILQEHKTAMNFMFDLLSQEQTNVLDDGMFHVLIEVFRQAYDACKRVLEEAKEVTFPQLANMPAGKPVRPYLLDGRLSDRPSHFDLHISPRWLVKFANQFHGVEKRLSRLHFKSLGNILSLQETIGARAEDTWSIATAETME